MKIKIPSAYGIREESLRFFQMSFEKIKILNLNRFTLEELDFFIDILQKRKKKTSFLMEYILKSKKRSSFIDYPSLFEEYIPELISKGLYKQAKRFLKLYQKEYTNISSNFIKKQFFILSLLKIEDFYLKIEKVRSFFQKKMLVQYQFILELYSLKERRLARYLLNKILNEKLYEKSKDKIFWEDLFFSMKQDLFS